MGNEQKTLAPTYGEEGREEASKAYCKIRGIVYESGYHFGGKHYFIVEGASSVYVAEIVNANGQRATSLEVGPCGLLNPTLAHSLMQALRGGKPVD